MASSKYKVFRGTKLNSKHGMVVNRLRKENASLKKTLAELSRQHSEYNKLVERLLCLETFRLESCQQDEKNALPSEQLSRKEGKHGDADSTSDEPSSTNTLQLQNHLSDALEKNKQWLEYDQQREAYVRAILARMLWLEKQLNQANQALSKKHNGGHSEEADKIKQMQEHYERLLEKAKKELQLLREQFDVSHQSLLVTQKWAEEKQKEVEQLQQQLQTEKMSRESAAEGHRCSGDEELMVETKELQHRLNEEKRRSANFELQANLSERVMLNLRQADQEKITDLERQIKISSQDLEDERQDCSYLKKQMLRLLKMVKKSKDVVTKESKSDQQEHSSSETEHVPSLPSRDSLTSSLHTSLLDESILECPSCQTQYPTRDYRELINHIESCLD